jgi:hypothetical protein
MTRPVREIFLSRWISGTGNQGWLRVIIGVSMKERFCENRLHGCGRMFLAFTYKLCKKQGGMCSITKCYTVEDGLAECASEGNPVRKGSRVRWPRTIE